MVGRMGAKFENEDKVVALGKLNQIAAGEWICECCNCSHQGLRDLGANAPHAVEVPDEV